MEFRCLKTNGGSLGFNNKPARTLALPFGTFGLKAESAPTFVEKVTAFLERYNRVQAQRVPSSRA